MLSINSIAKVNKSSIASSNLTDEVIILNTANGTYYGLDVVGARVWDLIQEPCTVSDVRDALLQEYEIDASRCEQDLLNLLQQLADEGLVEIS